MLQLLESSLAPKRRKPQRRKATPEETTPEPPPPSKTEEQVEAERKQQALDVEAREAPVVVVFDAQGVEGRIVVLNFLTPDEEFKILQCVEKVLHSSGTNPYMYGEGKDGLPLQIGRLDFRHSRGDEYSPEGYVGNMVTVAGNTVCDFLMSAFARRLRAIVDCCSSDMRTGRSPHLAHLRWLMQNDFAEVDDTRKTLQMTDVKHEAGPGGIGQHIDSRIDYTGLLMTVSLLDSVLLTQAMQRPGSKAKPNTLIVPRRSCYLLTGPSRGYCHCTRELTKKRLELAKEVARRWKKKKQVEDQLLAAQGGKGRKKGGWFYVPVAEEGVKSASAAQTNGDGASSGAAADQTKAPEISLLNPKTRKHLPAVQEVPLEQVK